MKKLRTASTRRISDGYRPTLPLLQRTIAATLMRPLTGEDAMIPSSAEIAEAFIKPNDRLTSFERLQIYNQQYWWRLLGTFEEDFRGLRAVLGAKKFEHLAQEYLTAFPSTSWTLRNLGQHVIAFVEARPELTSPHTPLALDVARVEWARVNAFDGPERPVLDSKKLAGTPADRLRLGLQPYLTLLALSYPIDELMRTLKRTEAAAVSNAVAIAQAGPRARVAVRRSRKPIFLAVHRVDLSVYYKRLDPEAYLLLCALRDGATLEAACEKAFAGSTESPDRSAARIQEWFARWMQFGWFCAPPKR